MYICTCRNIRRRAGAHAGWRASGRQAGRYKEQSTAVSGGWADMLARKRHAEGAGEQAWGRRAGLTLGLPLKVAPNTHSR